MSPPPCSPIPVQPLQSPNSLTGPGRISSKADLMQLRTSAESIDLTQLAELGRQT
ncbi:hypothetical protein [Achromobacter denitrificans]|uniref:Uncharacterized protein n=1 Tax=Achromobacter denitrificans TaxID=32002 RepID=A0ABZ3G0B8_ACHDE